MTEDVSAVHLGVEDLRLGAVAGEAFHRMWDVETAIGGTLHGTKNTGASGGAGKTNIQEATESTWAIVQWLNVEFFAGHLGAATVQGVQAQFLQDSACHQQTSAVRRSVVGQTNLKIAREKTKEDNNVVNVMHMS